MNYVFGREFQELTEGSGIAAAYHGQATPSRWNLVNLRVLRFERQSGFWCPRWFVPSRKPFQTRVGGRIALVTEVDLLGTRLTVYNIHLESRGSNDLRESQLQEVRESAAQSTAQGPCVLAGDLNFDVSRESVLRGIESLGFRNIFGNRVPHTTAGDWICRRPRAIDWAFVSRLVPVASAHVHLEVEGSDHYPISLTLRLSPNSAQSCA